MSNYKMHIMFGVVFTLILIFTMIGAFGLDVTPTFYISMFFVIVFYSLLPDIDHNNSMIRKFINTFGLISILFFILVYIFNQIIVYLYLSVFLIIFLILLIFFRHRGWTHSFLAAILFSSPLLIGYNFTIEMFFINYILFVAGLMSYISHLLLDKEFRFI